MSFMTILQLVIAVLCLGFVGYLAFYRVQIGRTGKNYKESPAYRRNNIIIVFVIFFFLAVWFMKFMSGDLVSLGVTGWKSYVLVGNFVIGMISIILILMGTFRKKK